MNFDFTPYTYWAIPGSVRCRNCEGLFQHTTVKVDIPFGLDRIKTKNTPLYAFNVGIFYYEGIKTKGNKTNNYVAIFEDKIQFLQEIYPDNWPDWKGVSHYRFNRNYNYVWEHCNIYTNIDFEGNVETGIEN